MQTIILSKMHCKANSPITYSFEGTYGSIILNHRLGKYIELHYTGNIYCIKCGRKTSKSFAQGYCYPCFISAPETEECVLRPELCRAHLGIARDMEYARENCLSEQVVYMAASESIKIGVTRKSQVPTRWIDQGAKSAAIIAKAPNRYTAGIIEVALKKIMPDKTNWRAMLTNRIPENHNFAAKFEEIKNVLPADLASYLVDKLVIEEFNYPVLNYPQKPTVIDFEKEARVEGILEGIKGQYLIFKGGKVLNVRKFGGYEVGITYSE